MTVEHGKMYGDINLQILLDDVKCAGTEENLGDCEHSRWEQHNCVDWEAVGVRCDNTGVYRCSNIGKKRNRCDNNTTVWNGRQ